MTTSQSQVHALFPTPVGSYSGFAHQDALQEKLLDLLTVDQARINSQDPQALDHIINVGFIDFSNRTHHRDVVQPLHGDLGINLESCHKLQILTGLVFGSFDGRVASGAQGFFGDGVIERVADHFADDFFANGFAKATTHLFQRHFSRTETINSHLLGGILQFLINGSINGVSGYANSQAAAESRSGFHGNLHN